MGRQLPMSTRKRMIQRLFVPAFAFLLLSFVQIQIETIHAFSSVATRRLKSCSVKQQTFGINRSCSNEIPSLHVIQKVPVHISNNPRKSYSLLKSTSDENSDAENDSVSNIAGIAIAQQSILIAVAIVAAIITKTPNYGLGPGIDWSIPSLQSGALATLPLALLAFGLDKIEDRFQALQDVSKATQRNVIALLGTRWNPLYALSMSLALGIVAGVGEEMLFRGVMQFELASRFGSTVSVGLTSALFGLLHAITPLYAAIATLASVYFGALYQGTSNLAVPILSHALYDFGALMWAHWTVTHMTNAEQEEIMSWRGPLDAKSDQEGEETASKKRDFTTML